MNPISVTADTRDAAITQNVVDSLQSALQGTLAVFEKVEECQDAESFFRYSQPIKGAACAVIPGRSERRWGRSSDDLFIARLPLTIVIGVYFTEPLDGDITEMVQRVDGLVSLARAALSVDPSRGGLADIAEWGGKLIDGTDLNTDAKPLKPGKNPSFYATSLPIFVIYSAPRT